MPLEALADGVRVSVRMTLAARAAEVLSENRVIARASSRGTSPGGSNVILTDTRSGSPPPAPPQHSAALRPVLAVPGGGARCRGRHRPGAATIVQLVSADDGERGLGLDGHQLPDSFF